VELSYRCIIRVKKPSEVPGKNEIKMGRSIFIYVSTGQPERKKAKCCKKIVEDKNKN